MAENLLVVKKYGNRRLYDTESSRYITLDDLARMIRTGRDVKVVDAKTNADLSKAVFLQIITEQEKEQDLLPITFLRKVIQHGDGSIRDAFHRYLSVSLDSFLDAQKEFEQRYRTFAGNFINPLAWMMPPQGSAMPPTPQPQPPPAYEPPRSQPAPYAPAAAPPSPEQATPPPPAPPPVPAAMPDIEPGDQQAESAPQKEPAAQGELAALKQQMAQMQKMLEKLSK